MSMTFDELNKIAGNPSRAIPTIFNSIESTFLAGEGTLNSTDHPFPYIVDLIVGVNYGFISRLGDVEASQFRAHARDIGDLSKTMSDEDWYGIFAQPSSTGIRFIISEETLDSVSIRYDTIDGNLNNSYRKLVIPPDSVFNIAGIPFLLENPVEIRVMDHGGYEVVYDSTRQSVLNPLTTNTPDVDFLDIDRRRYLAIHLPIRQLNITAFNNKTVNQSAGFRDVFNFTDSLYAVRAFYTPDGTTDRYEMAIVFNSQVYDPTQATLVIDLKTANSFEASVPPVYLQNNVIAGGRITVLVYTTQGEMYKDYSVLQNQYFTVEYFDYANNAGTLNQYEAPFKNINDVMVDSLLPITGGKNAMSFAEIKDLMIYGYRQRLIPVSNSDISQFMLNNGYSSIKSIDNVTDRLYRVTKDLPIQDSKLYTDSSVSTFNSAMGTNVGSMLTSLEKLIGSGWALDNGLRVTLLQRAAFDITQQTPYLMAKGEYDTFINSTNQAKIDLLSNKTFVYNPFTYVFDTTKSRATCRVYRTSMPTIKYQTFRFENATLGLKVSVGSINIEATDTDYIITLITSSTDAYKNLADSVCGLQLSFKASGVNTPVTMKGKMVGRIADTNERKFVFTIPTTYDIDDSDQIRFGGFNQFGAPVDEVTVDLKTTANFIFTYGGANLQLLSPSDMKIDQSLFGGIVNISIIETEYAVEFGRQLSSLYTRIKPITGEAQYEKYATNVALTYESDVYKYEVVTNPDGSKQRKLVLENGLPVIEHHRGEQQVSADGQPIWKFLKGQTVYDDQGNPVLLAPRKMMYYWDFIGFDFNYIVSQDEYDTEYMDRVEAFFVDEVIAQLDNYNKITLDETKIVFKPRSTMGYTNVYINEAVERTVKNDLSFSVVYMLTKEGMRNQNLKENLTSSTHTLINDQIKSNTVSLSSIISTLKANGGTDVIDVKVVGSAGTFSVDAITNVDSTNGFSVRKLIDQTADKFLTIKEDIDIQFKRHLPDVTN